MACLIETLLQGVLEAMRQERFRMFQGRKSMLAGRNLSLQAMQKA